MMIEGVPDWVVFAAVVSVFLLAHATTYIVQRSRRRAAELSTVAEASKAHFAALEKLLQDPAVSDDMKDFLTTFHRGVTNRDVAIALCRNFFSGKMAARNDIADQRVAFVDAEAKALQRTRSDLFEAMHTVFGTGLVITFLRWPETSDYFQKAVLQLSVDAKKERAFPKAVILQDGFDYGRVAAQ